MKMRDIARLRGDAEKTTHLARYEVAYETGAKCGPKDVCWLNPPFADIAPWAAKCAATINWRRPKTDEDILLMQQREWRIFFLVPAAVGSNWWADYVHEKALVVFPRPRLCFDGKNPYVKDVALCICGEKPSYTTWRWKESAR